MQYGNFADYENEPLPKSQLCNFVFLQFANIFLFITFCDEQNTHKIPKRITFTMQMPENIDLLVYKLNARIIKITILIV